MVRNVYWWGNDTTARPWDSVLRVRKTGMYNLWFVICEEELAAATVEGATVWKNPTGMSGKQGQAILYGQHVVDPAVLC